MKSNIVVNIVSTYLLYGNVLEELIEYNIRIQYKLL